MTKRLHADIVAKDRWSHEAGENRARWKRKNGIFLVKEVNVDLQSLRRWGPPELVRLLPHSYNEDQRSEWADARRLVEDWVQSIVDKELSPKPEVESERSNTDERDDENE